MPVLLRNALGSSHLESPKSQQELDRVNRCDGKDRESYTPKLATWCLTRYTKDIAGRGDKMPDQYKSHIS